MMSRQLATFSMLATFKDCRRKAQLRYIENLVPVQKEHPLALGSQVHRFLETWHLRRDLAEVLAQIDETFSDTSQDPEAKRDRLVCRALMTAYSETYSPESFEVVALERVFRGGIFNPSTGCPSRSFDLSGRIDGIVRVGDDLHVLENKTVSLINGAYLESLWAHPQTLLYSIYAREVLGYPIKGIIYNLIPKPRLQQAAGETEEQFEARKAELIAKSKSGTTSAKRKEPESDEAFTDRLLAWFREPDRFHREQILIDEQDVRELREDVWETVTAFRDAKRRGVFYKNPGSCFKFNRPCPYLAICRSHGNSAVVENFYEKRAPHEELVDEGSPEVETDPNF